MMKLGAFARRFVVALALLMPSLALAETRSDVINGATCIPYPPYDSSNSVPYTFWLYGFRQSAYCHFTVPNDWTVGDLSYVLFTGSVSGGSGSLRVRLCVYNSLGHSSTCGAERTITPGGSVNWVALPGTMPAFASGAYLSVRFPNGQISTFRQFVPVWSR